MSEYRPVLERVRSSFPDPQMPFEGVLRRRDQRQRRRRIAAGVVGIAVFAAAVWVVTSGLSFDRTQQPAIQPTPKPQGIFSEVGGWIAYGTTEGIWAVNPTPGGLPTDRIQLSDRPGEPVDWSSDGSKLLIWRFHDSEKRASSWTALFVLNADGTETQVVTNNPKAGGGRLGWIAGGSFSPDGSRVGFSTYERDFSQSSAEWVDGIYTVDADGGTPRLILAAGRRLDVFGPAFSPDGTQIAYTDQTAARPVDEAFSLRVMNADGTGVRVLHEAHPSMDGGAAWSPDGTHILYSWDRSIWVIRADGSGIAKISDGHDPHWSPDGSRIAFDLPHGGPLAIVDADGTNVQTFGNGAHAGPWNPLVSAVRDEADPAGSGLAIPWMYAVLALGVVAVAVLARRARRRTAAR